MSLEIKQFFDPESSTYTYLLLSQGEVVLIDPVKEHVKRDLQELKKLNATLQYSL